MGELRDKTIKGALWNFAGNAGQQVARFAIGIVLARILSPGEYGIIGMVAIFISVGDTLVDSGFSQSLIRKKDVSPSDYSTVFIINILIASLIFLLLWASSGWISGFFKQPILKNIIIVLAIGIIIRSFTIVQTTRFTKELNFRVLTKINIFSMLISAIAAIPMALSGYGVWSLVGLQVSRDMAYTIIILILGRWHPKINFNRSSAKDLFRFGSRILGVGLLDNFFLNINHLLIGKLFTSEDLGFYSRATGYRDIISRNMLAVINTVSFPAFNALSNKLNDELGSDERFRSNYKKSIELAVFLSAPLFILLFFIAEPFIILLITEKWLPAVPFLKVLCLGGIFYPVYGLQVSILKAKGEANKYLYISIIHKVLIVVSIIIGIQYGVMGLVIGQVIAMFCLFLAGTFFIWSVIRLNIFNQVTDLFKYLIITLPTFFVVNIVVCSIFDGLFMSLILQVFLDLLLYYIFSRIIDFIGYKETMSITRPYCNLLKEKIFITKH